MFDFIFRKRNLKRELEALRKNIELKQSEVEVCEKESREAWGKKWSLLQMQRRRQGAPAVGSESPSPDEQAEAFEMRRQQLLGEMKRKAHELAELRARERQLAIELGEVPITLSEANGETD